MALGEQTPQQRKRPIGCKLCRRQSIRPGTGNYTPRPQYPCTWPCCSGHSHAHSQGTDISDHTGHLESCHQKCTCGLQRAHTQAGTSIRTAAWSHRRTRSVNLEAGYLVCIGSAHIERQQKTRLGSTCDCQTWCIHLRSRHCSCHQSPQHTASQSLALSNRRDTDLADIRHLESFHQSHTHETQPAYDPGRMCNHTHQW